MEQELIKPIVKVGNSAGVVLPKEWLGGKAKIKLVKKPINIKKDVLEILAAYLYDVQGIYLVGSYAREEQTDKSDVDVLVITNKTNKKIEQGKYNLILISKEQVENSLRNNVLPLLPMLKEAKVVLNAELIVGYKKTGLTKRNLKFHIETTKSAMRVDKESIEIKEEENESISDNIMYSLVLRLRELYIVDCLIKNKKLTTKGFLELVKTIVGSIEPYNSYLRSKNKNKVKKVVSVNEARKIYDYIIKNIDKQIK